MKQKKEHTIKNSANHAQNSQGIQDILEQDLEQVAGGTEVSQAEYNALAKKRGPVVATGGQNGVGTRWERFADGETIWGSEK